MGLLDKVKGVVGAVTPDSVEDLLFGTNRPAPTPTTPDDARQLIDSVIGRQPSDFRTLQRIKAADMVSTVVNSLPSYGLGIAYDPDTMSRIATNNMNAPVEPYITADRLIGEWLQENPRR